MPLVPFVEPEGLHEELFTSYQIGHGEALARYRGSYVQNGCGFMLPAFLRTLFTRIASFAKPIIKTAAPHVKTAFEAAKPHLKTAASTVLVS